MHAILVSTGTDGDVWPFVALGTTLRARGHRVTLAVNEHYQPLAAGLGLDFRPLVFNHEIHGFLADPDMWHPYRSGLAGARFGARLIPRQYALLAELAADRDAVFISNPGVLPARLVQEKLGRPLATLLLQPGLIPSVDAPPEMPGGLTLPRWAPRWAGRLYWRLINAAGDVLVGRALNRARAGLGLRPVRGIFGWWLSPQRVIALFPDWYAAPQPDWPPQLRLAGFALSDGSRGEGLSAEVLEFCRAGPAPIVFTLGTGMMHASRFFRAAVAACRALGARGLLLTKYDRLVPGPLPASIRHCAYAPFRQLLPHCAAVVHHGGVGTVATALATGTPQLILPLAWDQPDNAARVKRLGAGDWLGPRQRSGPHLARALARLMTPVVRERCRALAGRFGDADGFARAADLVEEMVSATHK